ncbi:MAG: hypothetical protein Q9217_005277 [Psora testacea]
MEQGPEDKTEEKEKTARWYFAYGSNMKSSVMKGRGIIPVNIRCVVIPTHCLTFDIFGIPYSEPSFASVAEFVRVARDEGRNSAGGGIPPVHGVAYLLSSKDYHRLVVTEGGGVAYNEIAVDARILGEDQDDKIITVYTLKAKYPWRPNGAPSKRYMGLILEGAQEHQLPATYQAYLKSLPTYSKPSTQVDLLAAMLFLAFWRPWQRILVRLIRVRVDGNGHCPGWLSGAILILYGLMWGYHDRVHSKICGRGDGTKLDFGSIKLIDSVDSSWQNWFRRVQGSSDHPAKTA